MIWIKETSGSWRKIDTNGLSSIEPFAPDKTKSILKFGFGTGKWQKDIIVFGTPDELIKKLGLP